LRKRSWSLLAHTAEWQMLTYRVAMRAAKDKEYISSTSVDYLMFGGYVSLASHWLRMEAAAVDALATKSTDEEVDFYKAKVQTSEFVFERLLPRTRAHKAGILAPVSSLMGLPAADFSFDHAR